jgi:hypothetical protein
MKPTKTESRKLKAEIPMVSAAAWLLCAVCFLLSALPLHAQGVYAASTYRTTPVATNAWVPFTGMNVGQSRIFTITAQNSSGDDLWLHLCDTNGLPANGTAAHWPAVKVEAGKTGGFDFNMYGLPFTNGLCVVNSTTDRHITNGAATLVIGVIFNKR